MNLIYVMYRSILMVVGVFIAIAAIIGMRGAHLVNLELLLTYFWGIIILISPLGIGLFVSLNIFVMSH